MSLTPERRVLAALLLAGCSFNEGGLPGDTDAAGPVADAAQADATVTPDANDIDTGPGDPDAMPDADNSDAACVGDPLGFQPSNFTRCDLTTANGPPAFGMPGTWTLSTDNGNLTPPIGAAVALTFATINQPGGPQLMVITFSDFDLPDTVTLNVTGPRPLALVSLTDIDVAGTLSVGAVQQTSGPGGDTDSLCGGNLGRGANGAVENNTFDDPGGQGAGGGGFGTIGGAGGPVLTTQPVGGPAGGNPALVPLRGGCRGGVGGNTGGGAGGGGGGALQLVAAGTITITGTGRVSARGGGGQGSTAAAAGAGGGGAGGGLLLEAGDDIDVATGGAVTANGGGGGEGTRTGANGDEGDDGYDIFATQAAGGTLTSSGGDGGLGGADAGDATAGLIAVMTDGVCGGGGGGGGAEGRIHLRAVAGTVTRDGLVSPDDQ